MYVREIIGEEGKRIHVCKPRHGLALSRNGQDAGQDAEKSIDGTRVREERPGKFMEHGGLAREVGDLSD